MENFYYTETFTVEISVNTVAEKLYSNLDNRKEEEYRKHLVKTIVENCLPNNGSLARLYSALNGHTKAKKKGQIDLAKRKQEMH